MRAFLKWFILSFVSFVLRRRYRIKYNGLDKLKPKDLPHPDKGALFLPNHPAEVDPIILGAILWKSFHVRPMIVEWITELPIIKNVMNLMRAVKIPDFGKRSSQKQKEQADQAFNTVVEGLKERDNFMLYPAGRLKSKQEERLGGASGCHKILQSYSDINIVLVRTRGLWGSTFSRGWKKGKYVDFVSLYPTVNKECKYPIGHPTKIIKPSVDDYKNICS